VVPALIHPTVQPPAHGDTLLLRSRRSDARLRNVSAVLLARLILYLNFRIYVCTSLRLYVDDVSVSPVDQAVIDLVAGAAVWRLPCFEVDSFVQEVRSLDRYLSASSKADQSEAIFVCPIVGWCTVSLLTLASASTINNVTSFFGQAEYARSSCS
jgi:hypothetical protein